jgi:hypothetical protein
MESNQTLTTRELAGDTDRDDARRDEARDAEATRDDGAREPEAARDSAAEPSRPAGSTSELAEDSPELLPGEESAEFRSRWETIQTGFVDEPRRTVEEADELVAQLMRRLAESFAAEREGLEQQWGRGDDVSTEDLRVTLQRYRSFFQRLLSA